MIDEIRILLADDHPIVRKGLRITLEEEAGLRVVAEAEDGETALALTKQLLPAVAVLDIDMPKRDGFGVAREIRRQGLPTKPLFLTLHKDEDLFRAALELGIPGYILKDSAMQEIVAGVRAVANGQPYFSSAMAARLLPGGGMSAKGHASSGPAASRLTPTENQILRLIASGQSSKEIGDTLSIHYRTVENHRTNMCRKLGLEGANALLRFALLHRSELEGE
ncbi:MAG: response regulator transcription factor [Acidobacteriaceae bacterium]|nr:response regulator transcription factor [Acidobacteriaceae bacterium]